MSLLHEKIMKNTFGDTLNTVNSRLAGWKASSLSLAGRPTLIKSVSSSIPNHVMQTNLLPAATLDNLDKVNRTFLWGGEKGNKKIHLLPWDLVCKERKEGGLGIRQSKPHNLALVMKLMWRFWRELDALWVKLLRGKYIKQGDLFNFIGFSGQKSPLWRTLTKLTSDFKQGIRWSPRHGANISFWNNPWLLEQPIFEVVGVVPPEHLHQNIAAYILP